ncbi:MAG: aminopeptidase P family protein [Ahrensia sp.]|nr:aminopeptidase P family protein [Ahrensia sp.]
MFQSFEVTTQKSNGSARVKMLRDEMARLKIDAFVVPHSDEYQNEYLPECAERLAWLTGFTGSAGFAVITANTAHVFTDGRYTLQVQDQTDNDTFATHSSVDVGGGYGLDEWADDDMRVGLDPWLHTSAAVEAFEKALLRFGSTLVALEQNPIDTIWQDQPPAPLGKIHIQDLAFSGTPSKTKLNEIGKAVREAGADATIMTDPNSICWAFNIRGSDVAHNPLVLAYAIVPTKGLPQLFIASDKLDLKTQAYLTQLADLHEPRAFIDHLKILGKAKSSVLLDQALVPAKIATELKAAGATIINGADPCRLPRACKNKAERKGAIEAHKRDGAAMAQFLCWLDSQAPTDLDEIKIATALEQARVETGIRLNMPLREIAFDTISGSGPNGAIVHYRVNTATNRQVVDGDLVLIDSGGQYDDGTTDITRVVPIGEPTAEYQRHFTLVLKGMIAISSAKFPAGTRGVDIDVLARSALWAEGLDYAHGTGHGVGSYLSVHEGPQGISRRSMVAFETGMIVSNEPGYYKQGSHGIRIENLLMVDKPRLAEGGDIEMHSFTTLTLCPIDRRLIDVKMLSTEEKRWINGYHSTVRNELSKLIEDPKVLQWLEKATRRIKRV